MNVATPQPNTTPPRRRTLQLTAATVLGAAVLASLYYFLIAPERRSLELTANQPAGLAAGESVSVDRPPNFEILFSDGDRGLMVYEGYVYVVRLGDKLPNGRRMIGFQKRDGNWSVVTL